MRYRNKKFVSRFSDAERADLLEKAQKCIWLQEGQPGLSYLMDRRCLSETVIRDFGLGYIPIDVRHQLAGRIIFPLFDPSGNLVTLMSRFIGEGDSFLPHYWHEHYEKSFHLYAIDKAKEAMRHWRFVVVVEGQIDALQFYNHSVNNVVALCCTNMSAIQLSMIHRYCDEIILVLDSDPNRAGQTGTEKIMKLTDFKGPVIPDAFGEMEMSGIGYKIAPVCLPNGTDPDDYIKKFGIDDIKTQIKQSLMNMRGRQCRLISVSVKR